MSDRKFKPGDRIKRNTNNPGVGPEIGDTGTVLGYGYNVGVTWDNFSTGHSCSLTIITTIQCKDGHGFYMKESEIELIKLTKPLIRLNLRT